MDLIWEVPLAMLTVLLFSGSLACLFWLVFHPEDFRMAWRVWRQERADKRAAKFDRLWNPRPMAYRHLWPDDVIGRDQIGRRQRLRSIRQR